MQYIQKITDYQSNTPTVMTIGKFDGLHKGHQKLIEEVKRVAKAETIQSVVFAFDMHSKEQIVTKQERYYLLEGQVDCFVECPFTETLHKMSAKEFIENVLIAIFHVQHLIVGDDFRFGHERKGTPQLLKDYEAQGVFQVEVLSKEKYARRDISSTYIKKIIPKGDMELVHNLLGYPYIVREVVTQGKKIGRTIGVPTLNLQPVNEKVLPAYGVYFCKTCVRGNWYNGICNIGIRPTVEENVHRENVEVHLFDYNQDAYGEDVIVQILKRVRGEKKFADLQELKEQIQMDIAQGREYFG